MDHPVANLFRRPAILEPLNDPLAQLRVFDQFAVPRAPISLHEMCCGTVITIAAGHALIREMIALQFPEYRRPAAFQNPRHLIDRDLCMPPAFYLASFCDTQLVVNGAHDLFLSLDKLLFSNKSRSWW